MKNLKLQPRRRHVAATITIALATGFIALVVLTVSLLGAAVKSQVDDNLAGLDVAVTAPEPAPGKGPEAPREIPLDDVLKVDGVKDAFYSPEFSFAMIVKPGTAVPQGGMAAEGEFVSFTAAREGYDPRMMIGRVPKAANEVVIDEAVAEQMNLTVGSTVKVQSATNNQVIEFKVSGINRPPLWQFFAGYREIIVSQDGVKTLGAVDAGHGPQMLDTRVGVSAKNGVSEQQLADSLSKAGFSATTATELRKDGNEMVLASMATISTLLGAFVIIAVATSVLVVSNSFAVTMAQRRRSFALARALGATRGQAMGSVVRDALAVGVVGSLLGVIGAFATFFALLTWGRAAFSKTLPPTPDFNLVAIVLPIIAGLFLALAASIAPAIGALKVTPLEALRPVEASHGRSIGVIRTVISVLAAIAGVVGMGVGVYIALTTKNDNPTAMGIAVLGGLLLLVGTLFLLPALMRPSMRFLGKVTAPIGRTGARFAGLNAARHPKRTATTVSALVIGTALMAMMATGAATGEKTVVEDLTNRKPVDIVLSARSLPADLPARVQAIQGIDKAVAVGSAEVPVTGHDAMTTFAPQHDDLEALSQREGLASRLRDGELLTGKERAAKYGLKDGQSLTVKGTDGAARTVTVRVDGNLGISLVTPSTLDSLKVEKTQSMFAKLSDPSSAERESRSANQVINDLMTEMRTGVPEDSVLFETFEGVEREVYSQIINVLLTSTIVLLAVAVIVALVGVANTLSLSVVERTGENALLRALGTSRGQVQAMLAWEGVFIALAGAIVGITLGVLFGLVGVRTLITEGIEYQAVIPWASLLVVVGLAILAGLLASVIPGRVASTIAPAQALAKRDE